MSNQRQQKQEEKQREDSFPPLKKEILTVSGNYWTRELILTLSTRAAGRHSARRHIMATRMSCSSCWIGEPTRRWRIRSETHHCFFLRATNSVIRKRILWMQWQCFWSEGQAARPPPLEDGLPYTSQLVKVAKMPFYYFWKKEQV